MEPPVSGSEQAPEKSILRTPQGRQILFRVLTLLWIFPSMGAVWILAAGLKASLRSEGDILGLLGSLPIEVWLAVALLAAHGLFFWLSRRGH